MLLETSNELFCVPDECEIDFFLGKKAKKFKVICIRTDTHTHTHIHIYMYIYIWKCLTVFGQRNFDFMSVYVNLKHIL